MIDIAPAAPADLPAIHALIRGLADYERLTDLCTGSEAKLGEALFGVRPAAEVLLARVDGAVAGFALFFPTFSTFLARRGLWLEDLFVLTAMRGRGVGRALLAAVAGVAHARGCGRFEWAVLDWNTPAIGFYEKLGAKPLREWVKMRLEGDALRALALQKAT